MRSPRHAAFAPLALLFALPSPASAQSPEATVLLRSTDFGGANGTIPAVLQDLTVGADRGWAVSGLVDLGGPGLDAALFGDLTPNGTGGPILLRLPSTIGGFEQANLLAPSIAGGRLAYVESPLLSIAAGGRSVWLDDQLLAQNGDLIPTTGDTWTDLRAITHLANGDSYVRGRYSRPQGLGVGVFRFPAQDAILRTDDAVPGLPSPVATVREFSISPSGAHWIAEVTFGTQLREAIVVDGAVLDLGGGNLALEGGALPDDIAGPLATFDSFERIAINDEGDVALSVWINSPVGGGPVNIRNGRRVPPSRPGVGAGRIDGIDPRGFVAALEGGAFVGVDGIEATQAGTSLDVDGDGAVDPGWAVASAVFTRGLEFTPDGEDLLWLTQLVGPSNERPFAVVRVDRYGVAQPICSGRANSTGQAAHVTAVGSDDVTRNDVALQIIELPEGSAGIFIASESAGFTANPGGSLGDLCLDGSIGRYAQSVFTAGVTGRVELDIDLSMIPQPTGSVTATAGSTWYFQAWYRDVVGGAQVSNFSDAVALRLR